MWVHLPNLLTTGYTWQEGSQRGEYRGLWRYHKLCFYISGKKLFEKPKQRKLPYKGWQWNEGRWWPRSIQLLQDIKPENLFGGLHLLVPKGRFFAGSPAIRRSLLGLEAAGSSSSLSICPSLKGCSESPGAQQLLEEPREKLWINCPHTPKEAFGKSGKQPFYVPLSTDKTTRTYFLDT